MVSSLHVGQVGDPGDSANTVSTDGILRHLPCWQVCINNLLFLGAFQHSAFFLFLPLNLTICDTASEIHGNGAISGLISLPLFGPVHRARATWDANSCRLEVEISWHRWTEMGRVRVFCSEAFLSSEVRHERSCRGGHQLLPPKVCRSLWILFDAGLHSESCEQCSEIPKGGSGKSSNEEDFLSIYFEVQAWANPSSTLISFMSWYW